MKESEENWYFTHVYPSMFACTVLYVKNSVSQVDCFQEETVHMLHVGMFHCLQCACAQGVIGTYIINRH